ncbi:MAG: hypothetical protein WA851_25230 [Xanthobacteraceae bacterium]
MDIIASALAYLGSVIGLVVGLPLLGYMFFATPHAPTSFRDTAAVTQSGPTPHKIALLRRHKTGSHRESISVSRGDRTNSPSHVHYAVEGVPAKRWQKSRGLVSGDRENEWAYRNEPTGFSHSANYAQDSGDSRGAW